MKKLNKEIRKIEPTWFFFNSTAFWKFKKQMDNKKTKSMMNAIINKDGELQTNIEGIEIVFKEFYKFYMSRRHIKYTE